MNINGRNGLACITPLSVAEAADRDCARCPGLPVIRDLIVDMTQFFKQYHSIKPYLINNDPPPETERLQSPQGSRGAGRFVRVHPVRLLHHVLPVVLVESGQVRRPGRIVAGLSLHRRYARPGYGSERLDNLEDPYRLFRCHTIMNCVDVCPKELNPTEAIGKIKDMMVKRAV